MLPQYRYDQGPDTPRNPLGGAEADGFGEWLTETYLRMRDVADQMSRPEDDSIPARLMRDAKAYYGRVRDLWLRARDGEWEFSRDVLEVSLIKDVMDGHYWAEHAREMSRLGIDPEPGKRAWAQMSAEYLRACVILSQYTGVAQTAVTDCGGDQDKLSALRA